MGNVKNVNVSFVKFSDDYVLECKKDREKLEKLVANSVGFVKKAVKGVYLTSDYTYDDKIQLGFMGFLRAVNLFEKNSKNDFYTFAYTCIKRYLYNEHSASKRAKRGYNNETNTYTSVASLDAVTSDDEKGSLIDTLEDEQANTFKQAFGINSDLEKIYKILSPAQQYAFTEYFLEEKTLKEIAEAHGVTTTRAGNLTKQVIKKIKENFTEAEFAEIIGLR
jgi:RNA polymerase sigma factor (sigma-70 family)